MGLWLGVGWVKWRRQGWVGEMKKGRSYGQRACLGRLGAIGCSRSRPRERDASQRVRAMGKTARLGGPRVGGWN